MSIFLGSCRSLCIVAPFHWCDKPVAFSGSYRSLDFLVACCQLFYLLGSGGLLSPLIIHHRFSMGFGSSELAGQSLWWHGPGPARRWNLHLHTDPQQKESGSSRKHSGRLLPGIWDLRKQCLLTPPLDIASQTMIDCGYFTLALKRSSVPHPPFFNPLHLDSPMKGTPYFYQKRVAWTLGQQSGPSTPWPS